MKITWFGTASIAVEGENGCFFRCIYAVQYFIRPFDACFTVYTAFSSSVKYNCVVVFAYEYLSPSSLR